jgi:hypothetical protein
MLKAVVLEGRLGLLGSVRNHRERAPFLGVVFLARSNFCVKGQRTFVFFYSNVSCLGAKYAKFLRGVLIDPYELFFLDTVFLHNAESHATCSGSVFLSNIVTGLVLEFR